MSAFASAGNVGFLIREGTSTHSLARGTRGDLKATSSDVSGIRGVADQLMVSELHVGYGNVLNFVDSSGDSVGTVSNTSWNIPVDVTIGGDLIVNGTTTSVNSTVVDIADNVILVNSGPGSLKTSAGYAVERYQAANNAGTGDVVTDVGALVVTNADIGDQTGMSDVQIKLAGGSASNGYYVGMWLLSADGNARRVTAYDGTTKVATVATAWDTQPASNSAVGVYSPYVGVVYDATNKRLVAAHLAGRTASDAILDAIDLEVGSLRVDDGLSLPDNASITLGNSSDLTLVHNGTDSTITSVTGDFILSTTAANSAISVELASDDSTSVFAVKNSSGITQWYVNGAGNAIFASSKSLTGSVSLSVGGGAGGAYLSLLANNAEVARVVGPGGGQQAVLPSADSTVNLGSTSNAYQTGYFDTLTSLDANDRMKLGTDAQVLLALPVFSTAEIGSNIVAPAAGDFLYDSTTTSVKYYNGSDWVSISAAGDTAGLTGTTSLSYTINTDGGAVDEDASLVLISSDGSDKDTGTLTYLAGTLGGSDRADYGTWSFAAKVSVTGDITYGAGIIASVGGGNSGTNAPTTLGQMVFVRSDGLSQADAAAESTSLAFCGAYAGAAGKIYEGGVISLPKAATNAGGTTFEAMTRGQLVYLAAATADEYDAGVTPAKGTITLRSPQTTGAVLFKVGIVNADSADSADAVNIRLMPQYLYTL